MNLTVTEIAALLTAVVLIYKALTLTPVDKSLSEATLLEKLEGVANRAVERGMKLEEQIDEIRRESEVTKEAFRKEAETLSDQVKERDRRISALEEEVVKIKDWAERLVHQIKALGETPVPMEVPVLKSKKGEVK